MAERIVTLFWEHPRYGYRRIRALLLKEMLGNKQEVCSGGATCRGLTGKATEKAQTPSRDLYRAAY